ncbi:UDP-2,3-diacylglucosamine diphosphatase LpxI domain-containing protein, partial [Rhizobium phaseoli]
AEAAETLGRLDVGQGAVSIGGRIVALEGLEGTDEMLDRVAGLRAAGRISARRRGVLVKLCKPQQDVRADLPAIGLSTVLNAGKAGLAGIAVEAGRSLVLDRAAVIRAADGAGLFVCGLDRDLPGRGLE